MNHFFIRPVLLFIILFISCFGNLKAQAINSNKNNLELPEQHIRDLFVNMEKNRELIEVENYKDAQEYSDRIIDTLEHLGDIFIPIDERIKMLRDEEQKILYEIRDILKKGSRSIDNTAIKTLAQRQSINEEKTRVSIKIIKKHKENLLHKQKDPTKDSMGKSPLTDPEILNRIEDLLQGAATSETKVIRSLKKIDFDKAQTYARRGYEKLDEALQLLKENQDKNQNSDQENQNQDKNQQQQDPEKDEKNSDKPSTPPEQNDSGSRQKTSSKEALKELAKLMKEQNDDRKEKEKKYGQFNVPSRIPVEKDW